VIERGDIALEPGESLATAPTLLSFPSVTEATQQGILDLLNYLDGLI